MAQPHFYPTHSFLQKSERHAEIFGKHSERHAEIFGKYFPQCTLVVDKEIFEKQHVKHSFEVWILGLMVYILITTSSTFTFLLPNYKRIFCQSGNVKSKYCTIPEKNCFGNGQVVRVYFSRSFTTVPKVTIGFTLIDTHKDQNVRVRASVEGVTTSGFKIRFNPWDVSITYQVGVNWMACP